MIAALETSRGWSQIAGRLHYSQLAVDARDRDLRLACLEATQLGVATVVVNPNNVKLAAHYGAESNTAIAAAISYPIGADLPDFKALEIQEAIDDGARSIYMLMAVGAFREGLIEEQTKPEMEILGRMAADFDTTLITEGAVLSKDQIHCLVRMVRDSGVANIAVCTGFERSRLPEIGMNVVQEFAAASGGSVGIVYMGVLNDMGHVVRLLSTGVTRICTPDVRKLWAAQPALASGR